MMVFGTVDSAVQRGVQGLGVGTELDGETVGGSAGSSVASLVAASVDAALLASVAAELAEPPHAAREAAMQPAIATAAMFFIFMNIPSKYNVLYTQSPRETSPQRNEYLYFTTLNPQFQVVCKFCNCFDRKFFCISTAYSSMSCGWMFALRAHFGVKHKAAAVSRPV